MTSRFSFPTAIIFGPGARHEVAPRLGAEGCKRPLVVTDRGIAGLGLHRELCAALRAEGLDVAVFSEIWGNPVKSQVMAGVLAFRDHQADGIVGLGGGAPLDVAKAIALMSQHPGDLFDYEDGIADARSMDRPIPHWVAVPTTAGTGSEVGRSAVISDDRTHIKKIIFSPRLLARAVFADPELTVAMPAKVTAATGMDALTHNVEAFLAKDFHPICDGVALEGLHLAARSLARAVEQPGDLAARGDMLMSSMMGAIAFQKGLGLVHSCAHALGTVADLHHGLANGLMIDHALPWNAEAAGERFARMAGTVGLSNHTAAAFLGFLTDLKKRIGIPASLREAGVKEEQLATLTDVAFADSCHQNNPRPCTRETFAQIFGGAF
jgi:hypothetical protein